MSNVHKLEREVPSSLMTFSIVEIEVMLEVARHWMKMRTAYEIDQDLLVGLFFLNTWNPRFSIQKIEKQGERRGKGSFGGWSVMPLRLVEEFNPDEVGKDPFSQREILLLTDMMVAAVTGRLKRFMMDGAAVLPELMQIHSAKWTKEKAAHAVARKLDCAAEEIKNAAQARFDEWNNGVIVNHA